MLFQIDSFEGSRGIHQILSSSVDYVRDQSVADSSKQQQEFRSFVQQYIYTTLRTYTDHQKAGHFKNITSMALPRCLITHTYLNSN